MNCRVFKNRLEDYFLKDDFGDEMSEDIKTAMEEHAEGCEKCKELYSEEEEINRDFMKAFNLKEIQFRSSRIEIIKSIDKNRYSKSPLNKLKFNLKKNILHYTTYAAIILLVIGVSSIAIRNFPFGAKKSSVSMADTASESKATTYDTRKSASSINDKNQEISNGNAILTIEYFPFKFEISQPTNLKEPTFNTNWSFTYDNKLKACVEGRGEAGREEGIGKIYIYDLNNNKKYVLDSIEKELYKQYSPSKVYWWDNETLLITGGYAYGTIPKDKLYVLNWKTGVAETIKLSYKEEYCVENIDGINSKDNRINLKVLVYDDKNYNKSHIENITLSDVDISKLATTLAKEK